MKAIRIHQFGESDGLHLEEVAEPRPGAGQVLVRVRAAGVNPVDVYIRSGTYAFKPELPYTPGIDGAGEVAGVGAGVNSVAVGDRVYLSGTLTGSYAEMVLCDKSQVHPLAQAVSYSQGACVNVPYATAYRALFQRARSIPGEAVLVHGASGGVGIAAVQLARAAGMTVIGTAGTDKGRELVLQQGAHHVLDHRSADYLQKIPAVAGRAPDVVLEMLANVNLAKDLSILAFGGRVVVIGSRGPVEINPRDAMSRDGAILGMSLLNAPPQELASVHAALVAGLESGTLRPVVGRELKLAEAALAHQLVMEPGAYGKIVLIP